MADDMAFWHNKERARALFYDLLGRSERGAYDDDFLAQLAAYREEAPDSERADIFAARYLLAQGDAETAVLCGERAYQQRPVNLAVWKVLAAAYPQVGRELDAVTMRGHIQGMYPEEELSLTFPKEMQQEALGRFSVAANFSCYAPLAVYRASIENNELSFQLDIFIGEELPLPMPAGSDRFWVGTYVDEGFLSTMASIYEPMRHDFNFIANNRDVTFDIQKARTCTGTVRIEVPEGKSVVVPVAGTEFCQNFSIRTAGEEYPGYLGKWAFSYFRLDETATLHSEGPAPFAVGTPILLEHSPARKKLVLNLFVDGFCWPAARAIFAEHMPRTAKFFSRGVIFDQHFSAAEHTQPSLPAIETGCYPHRTQIFNERDNHQMPFTIKTVSERMSDLGYYAHAPLVSGHDTYYGTYRGYNRLIATYGFMPAYEGTERLIRALEALRGTDQFILYHTTDIHPLNIQTPLKFSTEVEVNIPLADRFVKLDRTVPSVRTPRLPIYLEQFLVSMHHVDRNIGEILSYIEEHYDEDEYIVNLYSDHGCALYDPFTTLKEIDFVGEYGTGAAWMIRGAGVPEGVTVHDLTSSVDIYPTLGHLCGFPVSPDIDGRLPAVFGGTARDAVYSSSQYPSQTYKLAVRTHKHVLRLETREVVDEDGSVDFAGADVGIYPRGYELERDHLLDSADLRAFFYPRARDFVKGTANNGEFWPEMRAARPNWFGAAD